MSDITLKLPDTPEMRAALRHFAEQAHKGEAYAAFDAEVTRAIDVDDPGGLVIPVVDGEEAHDEFVHALTQAVIAFDAARGASKGPTEWGVKLRGHGWCHGDVGGRTGGGDFRGSHAEATAFARELRAKNGDLYDVSVYDGPPTRDAVFEALPKGAQRLIDNARGKR